ncbi:hypothetical protein [Streptomyces formicae]|uniref:Uncharacterized protein n=1 Tax=Streptomyces formicae TaxID=1616117 RepID=A0A291QCL7_9ACTN|nr:hypothetical protein [Streptomyces formicae]ATL29449.1 hypothetical protein KY5_4431 [Streptomyces formicae]
MPPGRWLQVAPEGAQTVFTLSGPDMGGSVPGSVQGIMLVTTDVDPDGNGWMLLTEKEGF